MTTTTKSKYQQSRITPSQLKYLRALLDTREAEGKDGDWVGLAYSGLTQEHTPMTVVDASEAIGFLKRCPRKVTQVAAEVGFYLRDDEVFRVKESKGGNRYALRRVGTKYVYTPGMIFQLSATEKLTPETAGAFGLQFGICALCGRELTVKESVDRGIGPVCITRL